MQKLLLVYYHSENRATSKTWNILPNIVFPPIWGEKWRRSEHVHASYHGLFFSPAWVQPLYGAGRKESSGTGLRDSSNTRDGARLRSPCLIMATVAAQSAPPYPPLYASSFQNTWFYSSPYFSFLIGRRSSPISVDNEHKMNSSGKKSKLFIVFD